MLLRPLHLTGAGEVRVRLSAHPLSGLLALTAIVPFLTVYCTALHCNLNCTATCTAVLQMTAGTSQLAAEMEAYIRQTQESRGQQITVLKQARQLGQRALG